MLTLFWSTDESSQRQILHWVQTQIPGMNVMDFTTCWADGIAMCALVESLSPGACPRYDLLKSVHRVNNCRLALKLMQKHLNVPLVCNSFLSNSKQNKRICFICFRSQNYDMSNCAYLMISLGTDIYFCYKRIWNNMLITVHNCLLFTVK